jgi:tetratricopeptide (TPR) repeat protein
MTQKTRTVIIAVIAIVVLVMVFIYINGSNKPTALAPTTQTGLASNNATPDKMDKANLFNFSQYETDEVKKLTPQDSTTYHKLASSKSDTSSIRALVSLFIKIERPVLAGYYIKQLAESKKRDANEWYKAGKLFFESMGFFEPNSPYIGYFAGESKNAIEKALSINPQNLNAKSDLAALYIEAEGETMKGVGLLKEIIQVDSNHRQALLYLGFLSMQSKQFDKAVIRFQKLVNLYPESPDYHRFLGEAFLQSGKNKQAKAELEVYKTMIRDKRIIADVTKMINQIPNN